MLKPRSIVTPALLSVLGCSVTLGVSDPPSGASASPLSFVLSGLTKPAMAQSLPPLPPGVTQGQTADEGQQTGDNVPFSELNEALSAARARLAELTKAAEIAKVASSLREELEATKEENSSLSEALQRAQLELNELQQTQQATLLRAEEAEAAATNASTEARRLDQELQTVQGDLNARIDGLLSAADEAALEKAGLRAEIDATRESAVVAEQRGIDLEQQLVGSNAATEEAKAEAAKLAADLERTVTELTNVRNELSSTTQAFDEASASLISAGQESAVLREQVAESQDEASRLRQQLDAARLEIAQVNTRNADLQQQVGVLRTAAGEATDAARLNLLAVENQINEINAALATVKNSETTGPSGGPPVALNETGYGGDVVDLNAGDEPAAPIEVAGAASASWVPSLTPARPGNGQQQVRDAVQPATSDVAAINPPANAQVNGSLANPVEKPLDSAANAVSDGAAAANNETLVAALDEERLARTETLVSDLNIQSGERGLTMTVPGAMLFAVNSETIEPDAYGLLGKVGEMIDLYKERDVLIIGHTDAVGDDSYNQQLSERRANLVKDYFAQELGIETQRLASEGQGETRPIKSNATAEGRDANRRVEVIILD